VGGRSFKVNTYFGKIIFKTQFSIYFLERQVDAPTVAVTLGPPFPTESSMVYDGLFWLFRKYNTR